MTRTDYVCSDSEDKVTMGADYACSGSEDKVMMRCLAKDYFQDWARVVEIDLRGRPKIFRDEGYPSESDSRDGTRDKASARTQVYLSKTKLALQVGI